MKDYQAFLKIMQKKLSNQSLSKEAKLAFEASIEAIQKQIPMEVKDMNYCPNCNRYLGCEHFKQKHCNECGQLLDWD